MSLVIKSVVRNIKCELKVAENYIDEALEYQNEYKELAEQYYDIATDEIHHVNDLHEQVVKLIAQYERKDVSKEVLDTMKKIWEFEHSELIECMTKIKIKMQLYEERLG